MAGTTAKGLRYPSAGDNPAIHTDFQNLASDVDSELDNYVTTTTADATYASKAQAASFDLILTFQLLLGGM